MLRKKNSIIDYFSQLVIIIIFNRQLFNTSWLIFSKTGTPNPFHQKKADSPQQESTIASCPRLLSRFTKINTSTRLGIWEPKIEVPYTIFLENHLTRSKETKCQPNSLEIAKSCTSKFWRKGKKLSLNSWKTKGKSWMRQRGTCSEW